MTDVPVDCLAVHSGQKIVVCGCFDGRVILIDTKSKKTTATINFDSDAAIGAVACHSTQPHSVFLSRGKQLLHFDLRAFIKAAPIANAPNPVSEYSVSQDDIGSLDVNPEGTLLASGDDNGEVIIMDLASGQLRLRMTAHTSLCTAVTFSPYAENEVFSGGLDCVLKSWDIDAGQTFWEETMSQSADTQIVNPPMIFDMAVPDRSDWDGLMAAACGNGSIFLRIESEQDEGTSALIDDPVNGHGSAVSCVAFAQSSDGRKVISGGNDRSVILWDWTVDQDHMQWKKTLSSQINAICTDFSATGQEEIFVATQTGLCSFPLLNSGL